MGYLPERLHLFPGESCRGRYREATIVTSPCPPCAPSSRSHSSAETYANPPDPSTDPLCPLRKEEPQTIENWLQICPPPLEATRQNIFESASLSLKVIATNPERVLTLVSATLRPLVLKPQEQQKQLLIP